MSRGFRTSLKEIAPDKIWPLLRWFDRQLIYCVYIWLWARRKLVYPLIPLRFAAIDSQSIDSYPLSVEYQGLQLNMILRRLREQGESVLEGRHSLYLHAVCDIEEFCPSILAQYPVGFGLKIVKSQVISKDTTPYYTSTKNAPASTWFSMRAVGTMLEKMTVSNVLYLDEVAPRVYDIVRLTTNQNGLLYAFVVHHIAGPVLTGLPASDFMRSFKASLTVNGLETISIKEHRDLRGPDYNQNIVSGENAPCYVDIQNFVLADRKNINKAKEYLSERSFSPEIYSNVLESLERENLSLKGQKVLLVGEGTAGLLPHVLSTGARWCTLCLQEDGGLREYEKALFLYGLSRFELLRLDSSFKQSLRDSLFSSFDIICLDETTIPWLKEILSQISAPTDILLFGEKKENDVRVISQYISKYMPEEKGHISVLCLEKGIAHNTIK